MNKGIGHGILAGVALLLLLISLAVAYFNYFKPDVLLAGTTLAGITLAASTILRGPLRRLYGILKARIGEIIPTLDRHRSTTVGLSVIVIAVSIFALQTMLVEFFDRYRYVNEVRRAVGALVSDEGELPDVEGLVTAYLTFPGRREVPAVLIRTGRIFSVGGKWEDFVRYQRTFADKLYEGFKSLPDWCLVAGIDHDPVSYVATTYLESSVALEKGQPISTEEFKSRTKLALEMLSACPKSDTELPIRMELPRMIYAARVKFVLARLLDTQEFSDFNPIEEIQSIEHRISTLDQESLVWLFQTDAYQEFLDFKIKIAITQHDSPKQEHTKSTIENVVGDIRRLLALRMTISIDKEIRWLRPPQKMDTFRMFMAKGGFMPVDSNNLLNFLAPAGHMADELDALFSAPAFQPFLTPQAWYTSTPLDLSLQGAALREAFENWLRRGWT